MQSPDCTIYIPVLFPSVFLVREAESEILCASPPASGAIGTFPGRHPPLPRARETHRAPTHTCGRERQHSRKTGNTGNTTLSAGHTDTLRHAAKHALGKRIRRLSDSRSQVSAGAGTGRPPRTDTQRDRTSRATERSDRYDFTASSLKHELPQDAGGSSPFPAKARPSPSFQRCGRIPKAGSRPGWGKPVRTNP